MIHDIKGLNMNSEKSTDYLSAGHWVFSSRKHFKDTTIYTIRDTHLI